jgi:hypothetical protein
MKELTRLARLGRQMEEARQLRAETLASGWACAIEGVSSALRGTMFRLRGPQNPVQPYLQRFVGAYDRSSRI